MAGFWQKIGARFQKKAPIYPARAQLVFYTTRRWSTPDHVLLSLDETADVAYIDNGAPQLPLLFRWPKEELVILRCLPGWVESVKDQLQGEIFSSGDEQMTGHLYELMKHAGRFQDGFLATAEIDSLFSPVSKVNALLRKLAEHEHAIFSFAGTFFDPRFRVLTGPGHVYDENSRLPVFASAVYRKARSVARLQAEGILTPQHLPVITADEELRMRYAGEVAERVLALMLLAYYCGGMSRKEVDDIAERWGILSAFTPEEVAFVHDENPTDRDRCRFNWRYEALRVLQWALGLISELDIPFEEHGADPPPVDYEAPEVITFIQNATLRSTDEILDFTDLIYRCHWAAGQASHNPNFSAGGLSLDVCVEWHKALNWLIREYDDDWDEVPTHT